ncbi:MFS transporter [Streptomyces sp. NPDC004008]
MLSPSPPRYETCRLTPRPPTPALAAAVLGFFVLTFDAVVVNVALPSIGRDVGGGIIGLQWVADGYTLRFAALLSAGSLADRIGARCALAAGVVVFATASTACGLAPGLGTLVAARFAQGTAAAVMMPASSALRGALSLSAAPAAPRRARTGEPVERPVAAFEAVVRRGSA